MNIIVDCREKKMLEKELYFDYETKALNIGDIEISDEKYTLVIERKTWSDLQSSIKDSRFREQRSRLLEWRENNKEQNGFVYVVEGIYNETLFQLERNTLERLMIAYQIPVIFTESLQETCDLIKKWSNLKGRRNEEMKKELDLTELADVVADIAIDLKILETKVERLSELRDTLGYVPTSENGGKQ